MDWRRARRRASIPGMVLPLVPRAAEAPSLTRLRLSWRRSANDEDVAAPFVRGPSVVDPKQQRDAHPSILQRIGEPCDYDGPL